MATEGEGQDSNGTGAAGDTGTGEGTPTQGQGTGATGKAAEGDKGTEGSGAQGAPEKYEPFVGDDGAPLEGPLVDAWTGKAKDLGLSQEDAQSVVALYREVEGDIRTKVKAQWLEQSKADPEIGGPKWEEAAADAKLAVDKINKDLWPLLVESGLDHHPEVVRTFVRAAAHYKEGSAAEGKPKPPEGKTPAQKMFPNSQMNP